MKKKEKIQKENEQKQSKQKSQVKLSNEKPILRFSPTAWAKLIYFRDKQDNEIGGFAVTDSRDLLFVEEFVTVKQEVTEVTTKFDDQAVADYFDTQVDLQRRPEQFARIWLHTHPFDSPYPSQTDIETFERVFGSCDWAIMFILAQNNKTYTRLRFNVGPGGEVLIPVQVDYSFGFGPSQQENWDKEYEENVKKTAWLTTTDKQKGSSQDFDEFGFDLDEIDSPTDVIERIESMQPAQRQLVMDELAERSDLWEEESEVLYE